MRSERGMRSWRAYATPSITPPPRLGPGPEPALDDSRRARAAPAPSSTYAPVAGRGGGAGRSTIGHGGGAEGSRSGGGRVGGGDGPASAGGGAGGAGEATAGASRAARGEGADG